MHLTCLGDWGGLAPALSRSNYKMEFSSPRIMREKKSKRAHTTCPSCNERTHVRHNDRAPLSEPGGVDSGLFVVLEVCIESLNMSNRNSGHLSGLSVALEPV